MSSRIEAERRSHHRNSENENCIYRYYRYLKDGVERVKVSDSIYICPYCYEYERKRYTTYQQILRHASGAARTENWRSRQRHLGLEMYLKRHMDPESDYEELLVYPWMDVLANVLNVVMEDGRKAGDSCKKLKDVFSVQGYEPTKVRPLWDYQGHTGFAIVEFNKDWTGYSNAMRLAHKFEMENHGRKHWIEAREKGDKLYAWIACEEDCKRGDTVSKYLKKAADLKTISEIEAEDERKDGILVCNTTESLVMKEKECEEIKKNIIKTEAILSTVMRQNEDTAKAHDEEKKMHMKEHIRQMESMYRGYEQLKAEREMLRSTEKSLRERINQYETENEKALLAQKKADEDMVKLAEAHIKEKQQIYQQRTELEKQREKKRQLQLHVEKLRGAVNVARRLSVWDAEVKKNIESMEEDLADKKENLECLEDLFQTLVVKERNTTVQLQDARKEIIRCLRGWTSARAFIGVKMMGELVLKPFVSAAKMKYPPAEAEVKAVSFTSLLEAKLRDLTWWPFKAVTAGADSKTVVDEEDHRFKTIKNEWGDEVYDAVLTALKELNEYNPNGRYPVPELWHFREERKARLVEGIEIILRLWMTNKRKRN